MRFLLALLLLFAVHPALADAARYFSAFEELPLAPQLAEDTDSAVRFDQPEGRIIVLAASGAVSAEEILAFYRKTLPALGWKEAGANRFTRNKEALILEVKALDGAQNRLNILLRPQ